MVTEVDEITVGVSLDTSGVRKQFEDLNRQASSFSGAITSAFKDAVIGGKGFEDVLKSLALRLAGIALDKALQRLSNALGGLLGGLFNGLGFAKGGVLADGRVRPFAQGGVVAAPTYFPMQGGLGLMGEAGAEAVLPLARGSDGKLGIRSAAAAPLVVTFNVTSPDADSFRKSEAQVTAMLARAVGRGRRGL